MGYDGRQILKNDTPRNIWKLFFKSDTLMTDTATDINEERSFWPRICCKFFFKWKDVQENILPFTACSHP